ncbi:MAG: glucose-1-phosphate adenylyltransferase [Chloroflexi bacterium RBG_19FT_COMBO_47_9]|nr:MAG: glucose-1-phosphate adenylyltransferase [Chloroflexi bacterium RBG_19FT_COMBO_47_9]
MKTRAVILAGGEGSRLGTLTAKRTKPAVPFAGKYRIIDFTLSNCVNSGIFDVMIVAQYRPHSLIEHIGAGGPWDLNRDFTGGVRIYSPYKARGASDWFLGTADAVQQNFRFIKNSSPDFVLILSGDHIYEMNYSMMIDAHVIRQADLTLATISVPTNEASRFGIVGVDAENRVNSFVEKPYQPPSNLANMGVYLFNTEILDRYLLDDHSSPNSTHDFGKDILPKMVADGTRVFAYPYHGYWMDVGTASSYWKAHMDHLEDKPPFDLNDRSWIIHTRTEERPPVWIARSATIENSMICDGCEIASDAKVIRSVLSPGVLVKQGAIVRESIILTDSVIESDAIVERSIIDKKVHIQSNVKVGGMGTDGEPILTMVGKNSIVPHGFTIEPGAVIGTDVTDSDYPAKVVRGDDYILTKRLAHEV